MSVLVWIAAVYVIAGMLALIAVRALCWLTSEGTSQPRLSWLDELKAIVWTVVLWPLLLFAAMLVAMMYLTMGSVVRSLSRSAYSSERVDLADCREAVVPDRKRDAP